MGQNFFRTNHSMVTKTNQLHVIILENCITEWGDPFT